MMCTASRLGREVVEVAKMIGGKIKSGSIGAIINLYLPADGLECEIGYLRRDDYGRVSECHPPAPRGSTICIIGAS